MAEQFGIEKTKAAISIIFNEINVADSQLADGFQGADLIPIILALAPVNEVAKSIDQIKKEAGDYSNDEIRELAAYLNGGIKLRNAELQEKIQNTITAIGANYIAFRGWTKAKEIAAPETPA